MLLGVCSTTSCILVCCEIWGACCLVSSGATGAAGVVVGSGCIMLAFVRCSMGSYVTYSSLSFMRCGCVF